MVSQPRLRALTSMKTVHLSLHVPFIAPESRSIDALSELRLRPAETLPWAKHYSRRACSSGVVTMRGKSAILDGPDGSFVVAEAVVPDPDPNGLLVRQELCGICGTDAYVYRGGLPGVNFPIVLDDTDRLMAENDGEG